MGADGLALSSMTEGWLQVLDVVCRKTTWLLVVSVTESGIANEDGAGAAVDAFRWDLERAEGVSSLLPGTLSGLLLSAHSWSIQRSKWYQCV